MGPLADWENRKDVLTELSMFGLDTVIDQILGYLTSSDLRMVRLVSCHWLHLLDSVAAHREVGRLGRGWCSGEPNLGVMQCSRERSVCTVTALDVDERSIAAGLGSHGKIEVWNRRDHTRELLLPGHNEGVYSVALARDWVVSGGDDAMVRIWCRETGTELWTLDHHTYIVWGVRVEMVGSEEWRLVSASYDCTVCYLSYKRTGGGWEVVERVQGPWQWAEALFISEDGDIMVVQDEEKFDMELWDVRKTKVVCKMEGHNDEVHSVTVRGNLVVSGGSDCTVRLWDSRTGNCVSLLEGHEGKVWSVAVDRSRVVTGGRYGEVRLWTLPETARRLVIGQDICDKEQLNNQETLERKLMTTQAERKKDIYCRVLFHHPRSTSVASVHLDQFTIVSGDGLATVLQWDFWSAQERSNCPCTKYTTPVQDPLLIGFTRNQHFIL